MKRSATAIWSGDLKQGAGHFDLGSAVLKDQPYSYKTRFENESGKEGTNPEELLAAAHAACFSMQLSAYLAEDGHPAEKVHTRCEINLVPGTGITESHLMVTGEVPGITADAFRTLAEKAKQNCPLSKALGAIDIKLDVEFEG